MLIIVDMIVLFDIIVTAFQLMDRNNRKIRRGNNFKTKLTIRFKFNRPFF